MVWIVFCQYLSIQYASRGDLDPMVNPMPVRLVSTLSTMQNQNQIVFPIDYYQRGHPHPRQDQPQWLLYCRQLRERVWRSNDFLLHRSRIQRNKLKIMFKNNKNYFCTWSIRLVRVSIFDNFLDKLYNFGYVLWHTCKTIWIFNIKCFHIIKVFALPISGQCFENWIVGDGWTLKFL